MGEVIDFETEKWLTRKRLAGVRTEVVHGCMGVTENCKNPSSYGVLCVLCNLCERFEESEE